MKARGEDVARVHMILTQLRQKIYEAPKEIIEGTRPLPDSVRFLKDINIHHYGNVDEKTGFYDVRYYKLEADENGNLQKIARVQLSESDVVKITSEMHIDHAAVYSPRNESWMAKTGGRQNEKYTIDMILKKAKKKDVPDEESYKGAIKEIIDERTVKLTSQIHVSYKTIHGMRHFFELPPTCEFRYIADPVV